ncbi:MULTISPECIES: hypothetical protein [unclassified Streptomyces]|uniref:hypothetical protein n=1 Tax=unclassified Streptomyces TaxID=2593676 RepID=UPI00073B4B4D|nr:MULTISPECIES: hypothetical protein [unclassified Streptomyces]ODA75487.1 hypothetical protein APS67_000049 [Streptomyces sp. AVP053U2]
MPRLHIEVDDLAVRAALPARAVAEGARFAEQQPQDDVRVLLDLSGRPSCRWTRAGQ